MGLSRYICKNLGLGIFGCLFILGFHVVILVMGLNVTKSGSEFYAQIIRMETSNWKKAPIMSIMSPANNQRCPSETETINGTFYGINERCDRSTGYYFVGKCTIVKGKTGT